MAVSAEHFSRLDLPAARELLAPLGVVEQRPLYGGELLSIDGVALALWRDELLYLRAEGELRAALQARGLEPLAPFPGRTLRLHYYPLPAAWLADRAALRRELRALLDAARRRARQLPERPRHRARRVDKAPWQK